MSERALTEPLVSVLIATYNQKDYIRQALDSILMQRCNFRYEILIGEDCSTDGTREICLEYAENFPERIVLCLNEKNKGFLSNYFDIFLRTRGKYIADCGGDDYWLENSKLQDQVDFLEAHPEMGLIAGNWQFLDQKTGSLRIALRLNENGWFDYSCQGLQAVAEYLNASIIPRIMLASSCFRADWAKDAYHRHPELFREEDVTCEDLPLTLSLLLRGPLYVSPKTWLVYRVLENSLSHSDSRHKYMSSFALQTFGQTLTLAKTLGLSFRQISTYVREKAGDFALHAFLHGDSNMSDALKVVLKKHGIKRTVKMRILHYSMRKPLFYKLLRLFYLSRKKYSAERNA